MLTLPLTNVRTLLCLGAHADDIEIGCGGLVQRLVADSPGIAVHWVVFSAAGPRRAEAQRAAELFLADAPNKHIHVLDFPDNRFPSHYDAIKDQVAGMSSVRPDLILTHRLEDRHQDHRLLAEISWQVFRQQLILEYEIPKYEGDLGQPNALVPLTRQEAQRKAGHIYEAFPSQREKPWFSEETFLALARVRGVECHAPEGYAEGFYARKIVLG